MQGHIHLGKLDNQEMLDSLGEVEDRKIEETSDWAFFLNWDEGEQKEGSSEEGIYFEKETVSKFPKSFSCGLTEYHVCTNSKS